MAWQQSENSYPQQGAPPPPPPGFFSSGQPQYPGQPHYPGQSPYSGQPPYPGQPVYPGQTAYPTGSQNPNMPNYSYGTPENGGNVDGFAFSDKTIRMAFIRKVYAILTAQLAVTGFFVLLFVANKESQAYVARNSYLIWVALGITIVTLLALTCCESVARSTPTNYIFLFIFTIAEGFLLGVTSSKFGVEQVLLAVGITALICFSLTAFAFQTKVDFTAMGGVLLILVIILMVAGIVLMFVPAIKPIRIIYASAGAFIFSLYLIYDTQMMIGGNHKYSLSPEDYVFAALAIYLDIINIFLYILQIINEISKD